MKYLFLVPVAFLLVACSDTMDMKKTTTSTVQTTPTTHIQMTVEGMDYVPDNFVVPVNTPIKWTITNNSSGCMNTIQAPELGIKLTDLGEIGKITEFTFIATEAKEYGFTCSMGMGKGTITAVNVDK